MIGYQDGIIDLVYTDHVVSIQTLSNIEMITSKSINDFVHHGNHIYLATDIGIALLDLRTEEISDFLRESALHGKLQRQIDFTTSPDIVSSDLVGNRHACIVDGEATIVKEDRVVLYVWYDNEFGYSCQVVRVVQKMAGIKYPLIPEDAEEMGF